MDLDALETFLEIPRDPSEVRCVRLSKAEQEKDVMNETLHRAEKNGKGIDFGNGDRDRVQFSKLFCENSRGRIRSGLKLSSFKKQVKKELKAKSKRPSQNGRRAVVIRHGDRDIDTQRLGNVLNQLVADSHRSKMNEIKAKREQRRKINSKKVDGPPRPEDYDPWENFKEKPLPDLSRRTAIDCGVNVIQQELERENNLIDRAERLGLTVELAAESMNPHDASRLQLLYLHDDEAHRK